MGLFSRDPDADDDAGDESPGLLEQRGFIASAIVVGAIVICLVVYLLAQGGDDPQVQPSPGPTTAVPTGQPPTTEPTGPPATAVPTTPTPTVSAPPKLGVGGCKAKNPDPRVPRTAPAAVTWQFEGDMLIPLQQEAGPAMMSAAGVRSCFARTPTGAVLASMVLLAQVRHPGLTAEVLRDRIAPGPGRTKAMTELKLVSTPRNQFQAVQFTGFKVYDYYRDRAIISLAVKLDDRNVAAMPITMIWTGGDWKAVLQADGSFNGQVQPDLLQSLDGYVRFGGA